MEYLTEHEKDMVIGTIYKIVNDNETLIELLDESEIEELNEIGYQMKQGLKAVKRLKDYVMNQRKDSLKEELGIKGGMTSNRSKQIDEVLRQYDIY